MEDCIARELTCINHTASLSPFDMALYNAAPSDEMNVTLSVGGAFSLNVSLHFSKWNYQKYIVKTHERSR